MHVLITGAAGMLGRLLAGRIAADPQALGAPISHVTLVDIVPPSLPEAFASTGRAKAVDLSGDGVAARLAGERPDLVFHLAAVVSGEAEADFEKGYRVNLAGTHALLEAIRREGLGEPYRPRVVFASSIAVFGAPFPEIIPDDFALHPLTSYGAQKAVGEFLLADYSRRGFLHGIGLRLPTICVRPGAPNKAASGFFSNILREPLAGREAVLPLPDTVRHWFASPRSAVGFFLHAARLDPAAVGPRCNLTMPGLSATVGEEIEALRRIAGEAAVSLIRREPDETIGRIVAGWPTNFEATRARALGFQTEPSFDEIIAAHLEDGRTASA